MNGSNPNVQLLAATWKQGIENFVGIHIQWDKAVLATKDYGPAAVTLDMAPGQFPLIEATASYTHHDQFLVVHVASGGHNAIIKPPRIMPWRFYLVVRQMFGIMHIARTIY